MRRPPPQILIISYACTELGQRLFSLPLGPLALACLARNSAADHALMDTILAREGREGFAAGWLREQGFEKEANDVEQWNARRAGLADVEEPWR